VLPALYGEKIDWEAELAIVIGKTGSAIAEEDVDEYIAGYTVFNDISARAMNVPKRTTLRDRDSFHDWLHGKWFDTFSCIGPWIVTADDLQNPQELDISLTLNGEMRQSSNTRMMIYPIKEMVSFISHVVTLQPGDIIATGTPSGVGKASGRFLADGDVLSVTVQGIGTLTNPVTG
jgi:2-keto-4-pentenoate hydratase/2-oxohepta-3-ene-1,7-dioic acid hydratase in catechol pathway